MRSLPVYTPPMSADAPTTTSTSAPQKKRPPAFLFALGRAPLPAHIRVNNLSYHFVDLFKHDFFAATGLYQRDDSPDLAVLKIQRTYHCLGFPMKWLGRLVANHEIDIFLHLQDLRGIPAFLGRVGPTGFLHAFIPGVDLHPQLPLTPQFWHDLAQLLTDLQSRHIAYVDTNKRENILYGQDTRPWLIDFQISFRCKNGTRANPLRRWLLRHFIAADWYHFYKHKTRLSPQLCTPQDFARAENRSFLHRLHRLLATPLRTLRRKYLNRYDLSKTK